MNFGFGKDPQRRPFALALLIAAAAVLTAAAQDFAPPPPPQLPISPAANQAVVHIESSQQRVDLNPGTNTLDAGKRIHSSERPPTTFPKLGSRRPKVYVERLPPVTAAPLAEQLVHRLPAVSKSPDPHAALPPSHAPIEPPRARLHAPSPPTLSPAARTASVEEPSTRPTRPAHRVAPPELDIVETLPRVSAIAENQLVHRHVQVGLALAERGAYYSARREFEQALRVIAESLDAREPHAHHGVQLTAAFEALSEADEFFVDDPRTGGRVDLRNVAITHHTPLMREGKLEGLNHVQAMQAYYAFAQQQLRAAVGSERIAAEALYGLGRTYTALAATSEPIGRLHGPKSLLMHQVATQIDPNHSLAANELGVMLARFGQLHEAKQALLQVARERRLPETWHNLAVVHERLGEMELAAAAHREYVTAEAAQLKQQVVTVQDDGVEWVDVSAAERVARQEAPAEKATPRSAARPALSPRWPWSTPR